MKMLNYVLDEAGQPKVEPDFMKWAAWNGKANRHVGLDEHDGIKVSTVFLGLDHSSGGGPPVLWETMIFGGKHDKYQKRYTSRQEAIEGHTRAVKLAFTDFTITAVDPSAPSFSFNKKQRDLMREILEENRRIGGESWKTYTREELLDIYGDKLPSWAEREAK